MGGRACHGTRGTTKEYRRKYSTILVGSVSSRKEIDQCVSYVSACCFHTSCVLAALWSEVFHHRAEVFHHHV